MYDNTGARMTAQVWTGADYTTRPLAADAVTGVPTIPPAVSAPAPRPHGLRARLTAWLRGDTTSRFAPA